MRDGCGCRRLVHSPHRPTLDGQTVPIFLPSFDAVAGSYGRGIPARAVDLQSIIPNYLSDRLGFDVCLLRYYSLSTRPTAMFSLRSSYRLSRLLRKTPLIRGLATEARLTPDHVRIVEVGPRDGLQNEKTTIPLETKLELLRRLSTTGLATIEAGSFVPEKWVPQVSSIYTLNSDGSGS